METCDRVKENMQTTVDDQIDSKSWGNLGSFPVFEMQSLEPESSVQNRDRVKGPHCRLRQPTKPMTEMAKPA